MARTMSTTALLSLAACAGWMLSGLASPWPWQTRYDDARLLQCAVLTLVLLSALVRPAGALQPLLRAAPWIRLSLSAALLLGLISASRSALPIYAFLEVAFAAALVIATAAIRTACSTTENQQPQLALLIAAAGPMLLGIHFLTDYATAVLIADASGLESSWDLFVYPRYFAKAATWALPLLWLAPQLLTARRYRAALQIAAAIAAVVIWSQLIGSGGRGALLGMAACVAAAAIFFGKPGRGFARFQAATAAAGGLLWGLFVWAYRVAAPTRIVNGDASGRIELYRDALADIASAPLLGVGPMHYAELGRHAARSVAGAHDFPLQLAAEWGLPAAALLLAALLALLWGLFKDTRRQCAMPHGLDAAIKLTIFCAVAAAALHGLVANVFNDPISQTLAVLLLGVFPYSPATVAATPAAVLATKKETVTAAALILLALASAVIGALKGSHCVGYPGQAETLMSADGTIYPRFWSQGIIPWEQTCREKPRPAKAAPG